MSEITTAKNSVGVSSGKVMCQNRLRALAPSVAAAS